jgi:hypothetical protein
MLGLRSAAREEELGKKLEQLAFEDYAVATGAETMLKCLELALQHVQSALGDGGAMYPDRVPLAAALLAEYGPNFEKMEARTWEVARDIRALVETLEK